MNESLPLFSALQQHDRQHPVSFHVPGHKYGNVFPKAGTDYFANVLKLDATELSGLDDLHDPEGPIKKAQEFAAAFYGADETFFLVNGTTAGNLAMIFSVCGEDDVVLVQRNSHKSIMNGLQLSGARPVFLVPDTEQQTMTAGKVGAEAVREAIRRYPDARALILTHPSYYGLAWDLEEVIASAHDSNIPVLVDEAHGAHFAIGCPFPDSALQYGADAVVQSAHKTLPAMTMASFLHVQGHRIDRDKLAHYLAMLQSSSPSYPLMASLDLARYYIEKMKPNAAVIASRSMEFREKLGQSSLLNIIDHAEGYRLDPLKVTVQPAGNISGYMLHDILAEHRIFAELADPLNVLLVLPLSCDFPALEMAERIIGALSKTPGLQGLNTHAFKQRRQADRLEELPYSYHELKQFEMERIRFSQALGCIAAEPVIPYPPGIPLLQTGEQITMVHYNEVRNLAAHGTKFQAKHHPLDDGILVYSIK